MCRGHWFIDAVSCPAIALSRISKRKVISYGLVENPAYNLCVCFFRVIFNTWYAHLSPSTETIFGYLLRSPSIHIIWFQQPHRTISYKVTFESNVDHFSPTFEHTMKSANSKCNNLRFARYNYENEGTLLMYFMVICSRLCFKPKALTTNCKYKGPFMYIYINIIFYWNAHLAREYEWIFIE